MVLPTYDNSEWQEARLIPTSGISGAEEQERRAVSATLAVLTAVREFGQAIVRPLGAPAGPIEAYIEVPFDLGDRKVRPDGVLIVRRGQRTWSALVEVKTGTNELERAQLEDYLDVAKEYGFDVLLTISNQISAAPGVHPVEVDKRKIRKVTMAHLSWTELLSMAVVQREHRGVADPDQAWVLGELIRYLEHPKSGALSFSDMGAAWTQVRDAVAASTLRITDRGASEVVSRWQQLLTYTALRMERVLGAPVRVVRTRKEAADPAARMQAGVASLVKDGCLTGVLRVPDSIGDLEITADLRTLRLSVSVLIDAPREGRATTRVNWLLRQLGESPDALRVDATVAFARDSRSELLRDVRLAPDKLIGDPKEDLRSFRLTGTSPLGTGRATGRGSFIDSVVVAVEGFYSNVVQQLRPWQPRAPQVTRAAGPVPETVVAEEVPAIEPAAAESVDEMVPVEPMITWASPRPEELVMPATEPYVVELSDGAEVTINAEDLDDAGRIAETALVLPPGVDAVAVSGPDGERELDGPEGVVVDLREQEATSTEPS